MREYFAKSDEPGNLAIHRAESRAILPYFPFHRLFPPSLTRRHEVNARCTNGFALKHTRVILALVEADLDFDRDLLLEGSSREGEKDRR